MVFDYASRTYYPQLDETTLAGYTQNYGAKPEDAAWGEYKDPNGYTYYCNSITKESSWQRPPTFQPPQPVASVEAGSASSGPVQLTYEQLVEQEKFMNKGKKKKNADGDDEDAADDEEDQPKAKKAKAEERPEGFFQLEQKDNAFIYVQGLPTADFTEEKLDEFLRKCGVVAQDSEGVPKIKLYRTADGQLKGDARCCYLKVESVALALQLLDGAEIAPGYTVAITRATFEKKAGAKRKAKPKKKGKTDKHQKQTQEKRLLGWHEDKGEVSKKAAGVVVIKNMFTVQQIDADATYIIDLKTDLESECSKFGVVKKVMVFDRHPDGVCSVKFEDVAAANKCRMKFSGRSFAGRVLACEMWDGHTNYKVEETDAERAARDKQWEDSLNED